MLEAIVEDQDFTLQFLDGGLCEGRSIDALQMRHVRAVLLKHQSFVIRPLLHSIPAAQYGHAQITLAQALRQKLHAGSLARAAQSQVADADHGNADFDARFPSSVKSLIAKAND